MSESTVRTIADFVPRLQELNDEWRLRVLLHDFGQVWEDAPLAERLHLVLEEPPRVNEKWDAFLGAYVEHLCWHARIDSPSWVFEPGRYLDHFWYPAIDSPTLRVEATVHAPAAFEAHGVLIPARELVVV
ncbi:MAG: hypothetical protein GXP35_04550 [Actinobacteria bacterium]|nr:hypothetical protein [Actinomycetota bacterium]